jgi:hypothetical protein
MGVLSHAQSQMMVESGRRKRVRKSRVALGPLRFLMFHRRKAGRPASVELFEEFQRLRQIGEFIHEVELRQKRMPHVFKLRAVSQPSGELLAPRWGDLVNDASGAALGRRASRPQQLLLLHPFQGWIDLA